MLLQKEDHSDGYAYTWSSVEFQVSYVSICVAGAISQYQLFAPVQAEDYSMSSPICEI